MVMNWVYSDCYNSYIESVEFLKNYLGIPILDAYMDTEVDVFKGYKVEDNFYEDPDFIKLINPVNGSLYIDLTPGAWKVYIWKNESYIESPNTPQAFFPYQVQILKYLNQKLINLGTDVIKDRVETVLDLFKDGLKEICNLRGFELANTYGIETSSILYEQDRFIAAWTNFMTALCMRLKFQYANLFTQNIDQECCKCSSKGQTEEDYESWVSNIYPNDESYDRSNYYRTNSNWGTTVNRYCSCHRSENNE